jgi:hypothetical protein
VVCCFAQAEDKVWADLSVEMSEVALLVAEGIWEDLLQDTAETIASLEQEDDQQEQEQQAEQQSAGLLQGAHAVQAQQLAVA